VFDAGGDIYHLSRTDVVGFAADRLFALAAYDVEDLLAVGVFV
jgi:hypothetical protein